jgi:hypothetical protein
MSVVLNKHSGLKTIKCIRNILCGIADEDTMELNLSRSEITAMKYAPITSCDVERSFTRCKSVLRPNRRTFHFENLKQYMVCHCFPYNLLNINLLYLNYDQKLFRIVFLFKTLTLVFFKFFLVHSFYFIQHIFYLILHILATLITYLCTYFWFFITYKSQS